MTRRYIAMVPDYTDCKLCGGYGFEQESEFTCPTCGGSGSREDGVYPYRELGEDRADVPASITRAILAVNLDDLERVDPPESDEERYMRCERIMIAAAAEVDRLRPVVEHGALSKPD